MRIRNPDAQRGILRRSSWILRIAFVVATLAQTALAGTANLAPLKDNTLVQQTNPNVQQSGGQGDIFVGRTGQDGPNPPTISIRRGLIAFDIAGSVPSGSTITAVSLTMRDTQGMNGDQAITLRRLTQDWGEGASNALGAATNGDATWLYTIFSAAAPGSSPPWTTAGGSFAGAASGSTIVSDDNGGGQFFTWSSIANPQMLVDVQQWLASPATNFGWIMLGNEAATNTAKRFNGGESAFAPVLRVDYIPEPASGLIAGGAAMTILGAGRRRTRLGRGCHP